MARHFHHFVVMAHKDSMGNWLFEIEDSTAEAVFDDRTVWDSTLEEYIKAYDDTDIEADDQFARAVLRHILRD